MPVGRGRIAYKNLACGIKKVVRNFDSLEIAHL